MKQYHGDITLGKRAICHRCNTELDVSDCYIERDLQKNGYAVCFIINPCSHCLRLLSELTKAGVSVRMEVPDDSTT